MNLSSLNNVTREELGVLTSIGRHCMISCAH